MAEELKIVVVLKETRASVGIQKPEADPVIFLVNGSLAEIIAGVPAQVDQARAKWNNTPRYPKCETKFEPAAPPAPTSPRTTVIPAHRDPVTVTKPKLF